ncbi:exodeoxyribonuclease VII small subunit [Cognaticolwellia aestuarii]|jgi:exodeoxyribonuclease VII small subunit|uniref:exodeoxyribonuclease VII small subunit n=1 Tax=Cognaticolwellia aestuarii TaxID=329993 RepID=UPI0009867E8F|nr:exodeoxyribonuclease VII small subunit [Cognaticolwellia aestuarii]|tara:strand:+ start:248 stop:502 length:255 start_codon:yes stop_codon:yes gene_type:complete
MARKKIENLSFEESLVELDTIVQNLERGDLDLEDSMALFERGLHLSQHNQEKLKSAEQQINILLEKNGQSQLAPFNTDETISSD